MVIVPHTYVRRCCDTCLESLGRILVSFEMLKDQGKQEDATGQDGCRLMEQMDHLLEHTFYMYVYMSCIRTYLRTNQSCSKIHVRTCRPCFLLQLHIVMGSNVQLFVYASQFTCTYVVSIHVCVCTYVYVYATL